jgi:hypothetical protein
MTGDGVVPETPVTMPLDEPTVALPVALLVHVPPASALDSVVVAPWQTVVVPVIAAGNGFIVTSPTLIQPPVLVNVMFVLPAATPVTTPDVEPIVAMAVFALVHDTPPPMPATVFVAPTHTGRLLLIAAGPPLTVIDFVL